MGYGVCIPVIDMSDFPGESEKLVSACEEWGCFRVINHGLPVTLMSEVKTVALCLLGLPLETKRRNVDAVVVDRGYIAPNNFTPLFEGLGLYDPASPAALDAFCYQLEASPQQRETIMRYFQATNQLALDIGSKLVKSMGLASDDLLFKGWPCQYRMNKYNFTPQSVGSCGVRIHTDSGFLTILLDDDNVGGLEVMNKKSDTFIAVDPMPGSLLVNLGDLAKVWSNGRFCNVKHRVVCKDAKPRFSIALFVVGPKEVTVEAPLELVDSEHPRLYVPFTFEDYQKLRNSTRSACGEALELLRTTS